MSKKHVSSNIDLNTLAGGAFAEKINEALVQVGENIQNQNTEATKKRKITITMTFAPNKTRQLVNTQIGVTTTLAATEAVDTQMVMGLNMRTGQIEIGEYDGQIRGQMSINDILDEGKTDEDPEDEDADQEEIEQAAGGKPLDLRNRKQKTAELEAGADFDPETGEIFQETKAGKVVSMKKAAEA